MYLRLSLMQGHHHDLAAQAAKKQWAHIDYLEPLARAEVTLHRAHSERHPIRLARFQVIKTLNLRPPVKLVVCGRPPKGTINRNRVLIAPVPSVNALAL